ncbi:MaoC-like domain protein [Pseudomonas syringae pv. antirrhini]|uniref:MaoC-like domain protein n=1 Tax=Pseudomonas syringae pv. antirrhini TaxID=251702 RepID=A0A0P9P327_9PSED|nr:MULTISPECIES: MaoC family dehydratase [Pseudomonas]KPW51218.1 MaoC-like domain protein [Pseudomonas syringae pv. antirrhini]RMP33396.1 MaoC-like domain protein [Pseudomonas syringae pv. antirrhini]RMP36988.1 MaoC-like domain protein [Pseudomonas syringae pv. antirrhini]RMW29259.1 MaoC-like domain protein [Pseudomonas syringae pv. antirrhini]WIN07858.1 MaoC family dehydratase [Pseudomonas syringae pv. antirrhini str. 126]
MPFVPVTELKDYIGKEPGCSDWLLIDQERINLFAEATGDHQFIHIDPVKAAQTPFGATIAHGFLSLSLIPKLMEGIMVLPEGLKMAVNYGMDSVRFVQPVVVNSRVRLKVELTEVTEKKPGQWLLKATATLEIEGQAKPAFVADPLTLCFV